MARTLRTANHNRKRAVRRQVERDAFEFDYNRAIRPLTEAQLRRRANSGYVRRKAKRQRLIAGTTLLGEGRYRG